MQARQALLFLIGLININAVIKSLLHYQFQLSTTPHGIDKSNPNNSQNHLRN